MTTGTSDFWKLFKPSACNLRLQGASKEDVLGELVETLVKGKAIDESFSEAALRALVERERLASTGVGVNVAIPHVELRDLERAVFSLSLHPDGVEWSALDGEPVHLLFTVLRPAAASAVHDPQRHLEMMRWISRLVRDADFRRFARRVKTRTELVDLLKEMSGV